MIKKSLIVFTILLASGFWACAHKFYTSLTQVEYNVKTQSAEVIMNLFTDDLEGAVSAFHNRKIKSSDNDFKSLCYKYLDTKFQLRDPQNRLLRNEYVGLEFKRDMVSVYIEVKIARGLNMARLTQISLLDIYREQTNIVNLKNGNNKASLVYRSGTADTQTVNFKL